MKDDVIGVNVLANDMSLNRLCILYMYYINCYYLTEFYVCYDNNIQKVKMN